MTVAESGTGGGFKKFCIGETDINDASRPIKEADEAEGAACKTNGVTYVQLQVAIDGLTVVVNPANTWATCLTLDQLTIIYGPDSPENLTWDQVDPTFPNEPVVRYMPGADSGTFDYFTEAVNGKADVSTSFATQSEDDNVLVTGVAGDVNAISYFGYAYYAENTDKLKARRDRRRHRLYRADGRDHRRQELLAPQPPAVYLPEHRQRPTTPRHSYEFVSFYLANAATLAAEVGYIAVPDALAAQQLSNWNSAVPQ